MKVSTKTYRKLRMLRPRPATSSATQAAAVSFSSSTGSSVSAGHALARRSMLVPARGDAAGRTPSSVCQPPSDSGAAMPMPCTRSRMAAAQRCADVFSRAPISASSASGSGKG